MGFDASKINGYEGMDADSKVKALEELATRLSDSVSKANTEAADYKKQLRAKQTDDEAKAAADAEERQRILKELESLKEEKAISTYKAANLEMGYDAELAESTAKAIHAGDFATVFANQKKHIENVKKAALADSLNKQPDLSGGKPLGGGDAVDAEISAFMAGAGVSLEK